MHIAEGVVVANRYCLEKPLARGGMGSVWLARHALLGASVAVKFMAPALASSPPARARFQREAQAAAQIQSPHIVSVYDYGIEDGTPFLVMELLHGEDLGARIKRVAPLSLAVSADIIAQVARALRVAHAAGIVHRDLKPGNIFLVQNDDVEIAKVLDFGIAKIAAPTPNAEATQTGQILGSPQYMSPEQTRRAREVDARSDLWALAVIAYRMITGKLPFSGEFGDVLVKICTEPAPPPSIHAPELSPTIDRFFERALAKSPDHRFQTATALAQTFALAAGVNIPSVDKDPPRKTWNKTLPMRGPGSVSPASDPALAADAARSSLPSLAGASASMGAPAPSPISTNVPASVKDDGPPRSIPEAANNVAPIAQAAPRAAAAPPHVPTWRSGTSLSPSDVTGTAVASRSLPPPIKPSDSTPATPRARSSVRSMAVVALAAGGSLAVGTLLGARFIHPAPPSVPSAVLRAPAPDTRRFAATESAMAHQETVTSATAPSPALAMASAEPSAVDKAPSAPRLQAPASASGPMFRPFPHSSAPKPSALPEAPVIVVDSAPPPQQPPPAPRPTAPHRMFGVEE